jgi:hypothetical protein
MMHQQIEAMRDELFGIVKTALPRWQKELAAGKLGDLDLLRMGGDELYTLRKGAPKQISRLKNWLTMTAGGTEPGAVRSVRQRMWNPSHEQLLSDPDARRRINQMSANAQLKAVGGKARDVPVLGPGVSPLGTIGVGPHAGRMLGLVSEGVPPAAALHAAKQYGGSSKPLHGTLHRAVVEHEIAEKAMLEGGRAQALVSDAASAGPVGKLLRRYRNKALGAAGLMTKTPTNLAVPGAPIASHLGGAPIVAEQLAAYGDAPASMALARVRQHSPDDARVMGLWRRFGGRPDSPMPFGGKQHKALEKSLASAVPQEGVARFNRGMVQGSGSGFGIGGVAKPGVEVPEDVGHRLITIKNRLMR